MEIEIPEEKISKWKELKLFFTGRFFRPFEHPEYILYFVLIIIFFGGIGVWTAAFSDTSSMQYSSNLISNLMCFSIAIIATGSIELMFVDNEYIKYPILFLSLGVIILSCLLYYATMNISNFSGFLIAIPLTILALYIWWIANADNANLTKNYFRQQSDASKILNDSLNDYGSKQ